MGESLCDNKVFINPDFVEAAGDMEAVDNVFIKTDNVEAVCDITNNLCNKTETGKAPGGTVNISKSFMTAETMETPTGSIHNSYMNIEKGEAFCAMQKNILDLRTKREYGQLPEGLLSIHNYHSNAESIESSAEVKTICCAPSETEKAEVYIKDTFDKKRGTPRTLIEVPADKKHLFIPIQIKQEVIEEEEDVMRNTYDAGNNTRRKLIEVPADKKHLFIPIQIKQEFIEEDDVKKPALRSRKSKPRKLIDVSEEGKHLYTPLKMEQEITEEDELVNYSVHDRESIPNEELFKTTLKRYSTFKDDVGIEKDKRYKRSAHSSISSDSNDSVDSYGSSNSDDSSNSDSTNSNESSDSSETSASEEEGQQVHVFWSGKKDYSHSFVMKKSDELSQVFVKLTDMFNIPVDDTSVKLFDREVTLYDTIHMLRTNSVDKLDPNKVDEKKPADVESAP